jgi:hypothetical protein
VELGQALPGLLADAHLASQELTGDRQALAFAFLAHSYNTSSSLLRKLGDDGLAMIAADRAVQTAQMVNEPLLLAASAYRLANVFLPAGRIVEAKEVALSAAGGLERHLDASPVHLATWGGLILTAAVAAARQGDGGEAWELVGEAKTAARRLGTLGSYGALGDLLATAAMAGWPSADEISIAVALDSWKPTRGTLLAGENTAGRRVVLHGHRLRILPGDQPPPSGTWDFPAPFGPQEVVGEFSTTDVVTMARHLDVADVQAFINCAPLADLDEPDSSGPQAADNSGRSAQRFVVDVVVRRGGQRAAPWRAAATSMRSRHRSWWRRWSGSWMVGARPPV